MCIYISVDVYLKVLVSVHAQIERYVAARPDYPALVTQAWRFLLAKDQDSKFRGKWAHTHRHTNGRWNVPARGFSGWSCRKENPATDCIFLSACSNSTSSYISILIKLSMGNVVTHLFANRSMRRSLQLSSCIHSINIKSVIRRLAVTPQSQCKK